MEKKLKTIEDLPKDECPKKQIKAIQEYLEAKDTPTPKELQAAWVATQNVIETTVDYMAKQAELIESIKADNAAVKRESIVNRLIIAVVLAFWSVRFFF